MPTDKSFTCRCDTTLVSQGRSSDGGSHSRGTWPSTLPLLPPTAGRPTSPPTTRSPNCWRSTWRMAADQIVQPVAFSRPRSLRLSPVRGRVAAQRKRRAAVDATGMRRRSGLEDAWEGATVAGVPLTPPRSGCATLGVSLALLHESSLARTRPTDRILTGRCDTTLVGRGRSSDSRSHSRGRPHSPAQLDSGREDQLR